MKGPECVFLWRAAGAALVSVVSVTAYSLKVPCTCQHVVMAALLTLHHCVRSTPMRDPVGALQAVALQQDQYRSACPVEHACLFFAWGCYCCKGAAFVTDVHACERPERLAGGPGTSRRARRVAGSARRPSGC